MYSGKKIRLSRIFRKSDNKTVIVALDHGRRRGPIKGLENLLNTLEEVIQANIDAVMMTPAMISRASDILSSYDKGIIARIDGTGITKGPSVTDDRLIASVEQSIQCGADAVSVMVWMGDENTSFNLEKLANVVENASYYGVPVLAETIPVPPGFPKKYDPDAVAYVSRIAAEIGADIIKTFYTSTPESFRSVVSKVPIPVVILGGERMKSVDDVLNVVYESVISGGSGVAFGRNIFQFEKPQSMANAISSIVHDGFDPRKAREIVFE